MKDLLASDGWIVREERRVPYQHLKQDSTDRPPVDGLVVATLSEDLGGNVVGGADSGVGELARAFVVDSSVEQVFVHGHVLLLHASQVFSEVFVDSVRSGLDFHVFAQAEVTQFYVPIPSNQQVIRL